MASTWMAFWNRPQIDPGGLIVPENDKDHSTDDAFQIYQRELALVDEILGLRAALAQEAVRNSPPRYELDRLRAENLALRQSTTWRIGRLVLLPVRLIRRLKHRSGFYE